MSKRMGFHVDSSVCSNCKVCQIICKDKNSLPVGVTWRRVVQYGGGAWAAKGKTLVPDGVFTYSLSISCMHCEKPACVGVCRAKAITRRSDGLVLMDPQKCAGCRACQKACPYHAPQFDPATGVMTKCDFCQDLLAQGRNPACVDACPMRALEAGSLDEIRARYGATDDVEPLPVPRTGPALVVTPHRHAQASGKGTGRVIAMPGHA